MSPPLHQILAAALQPFTSRNHQTFLAAQFSPEMRWQRCLSMIEQVPRVGPKDPFAATLVTLSRVLDMPFLNILDLDFCSVLQHVLFQQVADDPAMMVLSDMPKEQLAAAFIPHWSPTLHYELVYPEKKDCPGPGTVDFTGPIAHTPLSTSSILLVAHTTRRNVFAGDFVVQAIDLNARRDFRGSYNFQELQELWKYVDETTAIGAWRASYDAARMDLWFQNYFSRHPHFVIVNGPYHKSSAFLQELLTRHSAFMWIEMLRESDDPTAHVFFCPAEHSQCLIYAPMSKPAADHLKRQTKEFPRLEEPSDALTERKTFHRARTHLLMGFMMTPFGAA
jgi:hypothetical protein